MENTTEKKLTSLLELQKVDKQLDEIAEIQGELPGEINALNIELKKLNEEIDIYKEDQKTLEDNISSLRLKIEEIQSLIKRCESHQMNVRNNREYDAITKEVELHHLDIQLVEKKIREHCDQIEKNNYKSSKFQKTILEIEEKLKTKEEELASFANHNKEVIALTKKRQTIEKSLDLTCLNLYKNIRENVQNKLAVVLIKGGACGGCFTIVHPQLQAEIKEKRRIHKCENCHRIIADVDQGITILTTPEEQPLD